MMRIVFLLASLCIVQVVNAGPEKCKKVVDIAMVVDESGSIGNSNFQKVKSFLQTTVSRFSVAPFGAHFGIVKYSTKTHLVFPLDKYTDITRMQQGIRSMNYLGGQTNTGLALQYTRKNIFGQPADRKNVPNVLILFSDGQSHDHSKALDETKEMKKEGVAVLCVAIGNGATNQRLIEQLKQIASKPEHVFKSAMNALDTIEDTLVKDICDVVDPCQTRPCQNDGKCSQDGDSYKCVCTSNYEGKNCEQRKNPCQSFPCKNGGKCSQVGDSYKCVCPSNYEGKNCEQKKNPCQSRPCQNGGKCSQVGDSYKCVCTSNFEGKICEHKKWCPIKFSKRGCYKMPTQKTKEQLLFNRRNSIEWREKWDQFIEKLVCDCGMKAKERGYNYFCIEFYGECWGYRYKQIDIPEQTADEGKCWGKRPIYDKCDHSLNNPICVGVASHGYVYELQY